MRIAVTGGMGRLGRPVVEDLLARGHEPISIDIVPPERDIWHLPYPMRVADLTDLGQTYGALQGAEAVVHCAAVPFAGRFPAETVFRTNLMSHFNVLQASAGLGIRAVVSASSIQTIIRLRTPRPAPPLYFPLDEEHPCCPDTEYGLTKEAGEAANRTFSRQYGLRTASIRLPLIWPADQIRQFPNIENEEQQARIFWTFVDPRDAALCIRLALETETYESEVFLVSAPDTSSLTPTREALDRFYPGVECREPLEGFASPISCAKAQRMLGFEAQHRCQEHSVAM